MDLVNWLLDMADPDAIAIIEAGGEQISYASLISSVCAVSEGFQKSLPGQTRAVSVCTGKLSDDLVAILALWRASYLPCPVTDSTLAMVSACFEVDARGYPAPREITDGVALVLQTSGTSGKPRGVMLSAKAIRANIEMILSYLPLSRASITGVEVPLAHAYGLIGQCLVTLRAGGTIVPLAHHRFPLARIDAMRAHRVNGFSTVPTSLLRYRALLEELAPEDRPALDYIGSAGEPLPRALAARLTELLPAATLYDQYGMTEAAPRISAIAHHDAMFSQGSIGKPLPGVRASIRHGTTREVLPVGEVGELWVETPSAMLGYEGDAQATARALHPECGLRTGDIARQDARGYLFIEGRADDQIKIAGHKLDLSQVASVCEALDGVERAVALDISAAHELSILVIAYTGAPDIAQRIKLTLRTRLGAHAAPKQLKWLEELPLLPNHKIDKVALTLMFEGELTP